MRHSHIWAGTINVVNLPKLDPIQDGRESAADHWPVLGLLDGDDMEGGVEILFGHVQREAVAIDGNAVVRQPLDGVPGNWAWVERIQGQAP